MTRTLFLCSAPEHFLQTSQILSELLRFILLLSIIPFEAGGVARIELVEIYLCSWLNLVAAGVKIVRQDPESSFPNLRGRKNLLGEAPSRVPRIHGYDAWLGFAGLFGECVREALSGVR